MEKRKEPFSEVRNDFMAGNFVFIDAWRTDDDNEEGHTVAYVHKSGDFVITDPDAMWSTMVADSIKEAQQRLKGGQ